MADLVCRWCKKRSDLGDLVGEHESLCPKCGNPALAARFTEIKDGTVFMCDQGERWMKTGNMAAVCLEEDSAYHPGVHATFFPDDVTYPV